VLNVLVIYRSLPACVAMRRRVTVGFHRWSPSPRPTALTPTENSAT
jgi:hypothetical protein